MKSYILILLFAFIPPYLYSQEQSFIVKGTVINNSQQPIENVSIYNLSNIGTTTNKKGAFTLTVSNLDNKLFVSHIAYHEKKVKLEKANIKSDTLFLTIILQEKDYLLNSVDIKSENDWRIIKSERTWIYDYVLHNDNVLVLLRDSIKYELRYLDWNDSILFRYAINERKVNGFIKDGIGNIHLGMKDSVFQLYFDNHNRISFYEGVSISKFNKLLQPIVDETDSIYILHKYLLNNQKLIYFGINKNTQKDISISAIYDKESHQYSTEAKQQSINSSGINYMGQLTPASLAQFRQFYQWNSFYEEITTIPIYSPLFIVNDTICIFNMVENKINQYNKNGSLIKETKFNFNVNKKKVAIETDKLTANTYVIYSENGKYLINEININHGTIHNRYQISNFHFPEKIRISNNYVYFLYKDLSSNKKLVKVPLAQLQIN